MRGKFINVIPDFLANIRIDIYQTLATLTGIIANSRFANNLASLTTNFICKKLENYIKKEEIINIYSLGMIIYS